MFWISWSYLKAMFREINADMDDSCQFLSCVHEISKCPMSLLLMLNSFRYLRTQSFPNSIYCIIENTITSISIETRTLLLVDLHLNNSIYNQTFDMWLCHLFVSVHWITWVGRIGLLGNLTMCSFCHFSFHIVRTIFIMFTKYWVCLKNKYCSLHYIFICW